MSLANKLKRELSRNKAKSGTLGVMCLVALYFWGPLLWGMVGTRSSSAPAVAELKKNDTRVVETTKENNTKKQDKKEIQFRWNELLEWITDDPRMASATLADEQFDPFRSIKRPKPKVDEIVKAPESAPKQQPKQTRKPMPDVSPEQLGLQLTSTIIGRRFRVATINETRYLQNHIVVVSSVKSPEGGDPADHVNFHLTEIHPKHVVLTRNGKSYQLVIHRANLTPRESLFPNDPGFYEQSSLAND